MNEPLSICCDDDIRRTAVLNSDLTGIDAIEVPRSADALPPELFGPQIGLPPPATNEEANRYLLVDLIRPPAAVFADLVDHPEHVSVLGGVRVLGIRVLSVHRVGDRLVVRCDRSGDFSTYELVLSGSEHLDPVFARCPFTFKAGCPSRFDCAPHTTCPAPELPTPTIDYLAKDYGSFRQALFDLLPTLMPAWRENQPADVGTTLIELLAYAGDQLSYYQDAVANEAFLETARQRVSVRRHALLVDYPMHDGLSARAFVHLRVREGGGGGLIPAGTAFLSRCEPKLEAHPFEVVIEDQIRYAAMADAGASVFESLEVVAIHEGLNQLELYTWQSARCHLPMGATGCTLMGDVTARLRPGDLLLLEERVGALSGLEADADPTHRQVVRVRSVRPTTDPLSPGQPLTHVVWHPRDALRFALCVSSAADPAVGVARGNVVLADHGRTLPEEVHRGRREPVHPIQERAFRFLLERGPLSQRVPTGNPDDPASALLDIDPRSARPEIELWTYRPKSAQPGEPLKPPAPDERGQSWRPRRHLLESREEEAHFAVEVDDQGRAQLRFGREGLGREPEIGTDVVVRYRIGIGVAGNVGAGALAHVFLLDGLIDIEKVRNPLPAWGGVDPEPIERVRLLAPAAYRADQPRAVTPADYERVVELHPQVSRAAATLRWTGSWYTVFLTIDRQGGARIDAAFEAELTAHLERYRMTGYDLEIQPPVLVPLEIEADVCVAATHFRSDVERAVLERLFGGGSGRGARAFFDPDELTLGQSVWLSRLLAAICEVPGVSSATVPVFHRYGRVAASEQENGVIPIARLEIAQLENDVNAPENGCLRLNLMGGK